MTGIQGHCHPVGSLIRFKGPCTLPRLKPTASCLYPTTLLPLVWLVGQKSCNELTAWRAAYSTVAYTFNRIWRNRVHRKTKRTQYSTPPTHRAESLAHLQSEWSYSWHTTNQRIWWLGRPTANLLRLQMLNRSRQCCKAPKVSNAAEHTEKIYSRPRLSLPKRFRRPTVGPVCSCLKFQKDLLSLGS